MHRIETPGSGLDIPHLRQADLHAGRKRWDSSSSPYAFCGNNPVNFVDLDGRDTIYVFDTPYRPNDKGVYGETYTAETYVEINGKLSGPYRSSSYPNSRSNADNSTPYNTVLEAIMIKFQ